MTACVYDKRLRCQQRFDLFEQKEPFLAMRNLARRWRLQNQRCVFNFCRQRRNARVVRGTFSACERSACLLRSQATYRDTRNHKFVGGSQGGRKERRIELDEHMFCLVQAPDQEKTPDFEMARMCCVQPIAVLFKCRSCRFERFRRPAEITRDKRDLGFGDETSCASHRFSRTEGARRTSQQRLRTYEIAELGHRNASKRERWRIVAQRNSLQRA
jgi:hypothetical protein